MLGRLAYCIVSLLLNLDMMVQTLCLSLIYIPTGHWQPNARLSISALFGWARARGYGWGQIGAAIIDEIMLNRLHCAQAMAKDAAFEAGLH